MVSLLILWFTEDFHKFIAFEFHTPCLLCLLWHTILETQQALGTLMFNVLILQINEVRFRERKQIAQSHTHSKLARLALEPRSLNIKFCVFPQHNAEYTMLAPWTTLITCTKSGPWAVLVPHTIILIFCVGSKYCLYVLLCLNHFGSLLFPCAMSHSYHVPCWLHVFYWLLWYYGRLYHYLLFAALPVITHACPLSCDMHYFSAGRKYFLPPWGHLNMWPALANGMWAKRCVSLLKCFISHHLFWPLFLSLCHKNGMFQIRASPSGWIWDCTRP